MKIWSKILLAVIAVFSFQSAFSQHLRYCDFMKITQKTKTDDLMEFMDSTGYDFMGLCNNQKVVFADWKINLSGLLRGFDGLYWDIEENPDYGIVEIQEGMRNCYKTYYYYFASETARDSILNDAQQDGFSFVNEGVGDNGSKFKVFTKDYQDYQETLCLYEVSSPGGFCIKYFRRGAAKESPDKYILFFMQNNTNR